MNIYISIIYGDRPINEKHIDLNIRTHPDTETTRTNTHGNDLNSQHLNCWINTHERGYFNVCVPFLLILKRLSTIDLFNKMKPNVGSW